MGDDALLRIYRLALDRTCHVLEPRPGHPGLAALEAFLLLLPELPKVSAAYERDPYWETMDDNANALDVFLFAHFDDYRGVQRYRVMAPPIGNYLFSDNAP